ncbi:amino acid ABC transporter substrate-binding protein [Mammaliicoccus sciuri]|uniref:Amino acid ABC superfamily ATP binding cassette transporter, binding protein n=1 Tax=Sporosarcina newyorkensis 2681 TaxID=1027292 RepID=F9DP02_9BACL|nr:amino acid ABC transporter substrate-binding protein [Sporosarcina newyorkensis]EGQ27411.1 amino acid ABC superfamily ATP binding cassette transporter, binding protein [Sporosarcina newyorkensis 2681]
MKKSFIFLFAVLLLVMAGCSDKSAEGDSPATSADTGKDKEVKEIIIGVDDKFAPMGFRDDKNELVGFDIDMAKAAAEHMGAEAKFQPIDWKTKETELSSGRIDLIWNGYTITNERKEKVLFTKPYLDNNQVVVTLADSDIGKVEELDGKVVGLQALSSAGPALESHPIHEKLKTVTEFADNVLALTDLKTGRLDAVVLDEVVIDYYMTKEEGVFKKLDGSLAVEEYGIGVKKGNEELLENLQKALDTMNEDGTSADISTEWFGEDKLLR